MTEFCLFLSIACILLSVLIAVWVRMKKRSGAGFFYCIFAGVLLGSIAAIFPVSYEAMAEETLRGGKAFFLSVFYAFQFFTIGAEGSLITEPVTCASAQLLSVYRLLLSILYVLAPIMTFSFLAFLFRNLFASLCFKLCRGKTLYAFSELNICSISLAEDIRKNHPRAAIVFTDVFDREDELGMELAERARKIRAIHFKKDILSLNLRKHSRDKEIYLFLIGEDEQENVNHSLRLMDTYGSMEHINLYVFTTNMESELLLTHTENIAMTVRRVNHVQSLVYRVLDEEGCRLFETARPNSEGLKIIHAVIVGLGKYGREMAKALAWYCQMDGYRLELDVFDKDPLAEDRFCALCPELMSKERNGVFEDGEAQYTIRIHSGMEAGTKTFADAVSALRHTTFAFVSLGTDEENIATAADLRLLFERCGVDPDATPEKILPIIQAVVYNADAVQALQDVRNFKNQAYCIEFIGDITGIYSEGAVLHSQLEDDALARHMVWGDEPSFWRYEYNYRSSMTSAIHIQARYLCKIPGADKQIKDQTPEEYEALRKQEHCRWNAYMRSEGYVFSGSLDKSSRSDRAKMHCYLTNYYLLPESVKDADAHDGITDPSKLRRKEGTS